MALKREGDAAHQGLPVFMAIEPFYAEQILAGTKTVELRTKPLEVRLGTPIVIYASREVGRVVGVAEYAGLLRAPPDALWGRVRARAGIERRDYDAYFGDKPEAYAIQLRNPRRVSPVKPGWRVQPGWMFLRAENPQHLKVLEAASLI